MTEKEWLASDHPGATLAFVAARAGDRKVRLFACACCRRIWHLLHDERSREAIAVAERYADGQATLRELFEAATAAVLVADERIGAEEASTEAVYYAVGAVAEGEGAEDVDTGEQLANVVDAVTD